MKKIADVNIKIKENISLFVSYVLLLALTFAFVILGAGTLEVQGEMIIITGGGIVENNNHGIFGFGDLLSIGGFVAKYKGEVGDDDDDDACVELYAKGQIEAKATIAGAPLRPIGAIHGKVVCIANLGPDACGSQNENDVWEVRFQVTHSRGLFTVPVDAYGSLIVQDNATPGSAGDLVDESFINPDDEDCCLLDVDRDCGLEDVLHGNFMVLD